MCTVLVVGELRERNLTPEVRREERVCFRDLKSHLVSDSAYNGHIET